MECVGDVTNGFFLRRLFRDRMRNIKRTYGQFLRISWAFCSSFIWVSKLYLYPNSHHVDLTLSSCSKAKLLLDEPTRS